MIEQVHKSGTIFHPKLCEDSCWEQLVLWQRYSSCLRLIRKKSLSELYLSLSGCPLLDCRTFCGLPDPEALNCLRSLIVGPAAFLWNSKGEAVERERIPLQNNVPGEKVEAGISMLPICSHKNCRGQNKQDYSHEPLKNLVADKVTNHTLMWQRFRRA